MSVSISRYPGAKRFLKDDSGILVKAMYGILSLKMMSSFMRRYDPGPHHIGRGSTIGGNVWLTHSVPLTAISLRRMHAVNCSIAVPEYEIF